VSTQADRDAILALPKTVAAHDAHLAGQVCMKQVEVGGAAPVAPLAFPFTIAAWNLERCLFPDQIPLDQKIASVTADGAFDTRKCHDAIAACGAAAIIPPRKNAKPWKPDTAGAIARNEALRASKRFGRTIWRRCSGYHRRSRVEI